MARRSTQTRGIYRITTSHPSLAGSTLDRELLPNGRITLFGKVVVVLAFFCRWRRAHSGCRLSQHRGKRPLQHSWPATFSGGQGMKRVFRFLLPLASITAGILGAPSVQAHPAPSTTPLEPAAAPQPPNSGPDDDGLMKVDVGPDRFEFILKRNADGEVFADHRSHGSHGSHGSHSSHRSSNYY
jgi:hypothetical protein